MLHDMIQSKNIYLIILTFLIFLSLFFLIKSILLLLVGPQRRQQRRLKERLKALEGLDVTISAGTLLKKASLKKSFMEKLQFIKHLQTLMSRADLTWNISTFLIVCGLTSLVGFVLGMGKWGLFGGTVGGGIGMLIPYRLLVRRGKKRLRKFEQQLPDALDLLARGLKAGHAFPSGLQQVAQEMPDPLGSEFAILYREFSHGMAMNKALLGLRERIDLRDLDFFITSVLIQRETGGNLTEVLEKISNLIRARFQLRNQIQALTAEGRLSGWVLCLLPPGLMVVMMFINPKYISVLFQHPSGQLVLGAAGFFQLLGMLIIRKIVNIKV